ncbi:MAG: GNAT family N-acetyltransferase [Burkholderiales bacterium PBB5]|nr:MAG: GNAT family N-acetyltransferase [Burkholderiales bacterium PBB5]
MTLPAHHLHTLSAPTDDDLQGLAELLCDCVDGGASVSFMAPCTLDQALAFWRGVADGVLRGERALLVARNAQGQIDGTVQLVLAQPPNQPHRADLAKMLVHRRARRQGLAERLLQAADALALQHGKTLLVLDTVTGGDAERLYARLGWQRVGEVPGYALFPDGRPCGTTFFYKALAASVARAGSTTGLSAGMAGSAA